MILVGAGRYVMVRSANSAAIKMTYVRQATNSRHYIQLISKQIQHSKYSWMQYQLFPTRARS